MAWHGGGCVFATVCKYGARRYYDAVWQEHTASVWKACPTIAVDTMHIRFGVTILPFAAAFAVLRSLCRHCNA